MLLHPFPFSRHIWAGLADELAAHRRVITVDARGFGGAPLDGTLRAHRCRRRRGRAARPVEHRARDAAGHVDGRLHRARVRRPPRASGWRRWSSPTRAPPPTAPRHAPGARPRSRSSSRDGPAAYLASSLPRLLSPAAPPALVAYLRARAETRAASLVAGIEALRDRPDRSGELAAIACPVLVVCGDGDQVTPPAEMQQVAAAIPGARFVSVAGAGHIAHVEAEGAFSRALAVSSRTSIARGRVDDEAGRRLLRTRAGRGAGRGAAARHRQRRRRRRARLRAGRRRRSPGGRAQHPLRVAARIPRDHGRRPPRPAGRGDDRGQDGAAAVRPRARLRRLPAQRGRLRRPRRRRDGRAHADRDQRVGRRWSRRCSPARSSRSRTTST